MKTTIQLLLVIFFPMLLTAQVNYAQMQEIITDFKKIKQQCNDSAGISFTMKYLYSKESKPAQYLDSLTCLFKTKNGWCYSKIANTEVVQDDSVCVTIYLLEKLIMVGNKVKERTNNLLLDSWDSSFVSNNIDTAYTGTTGNEKTMHFRFKQTSPFYNCSMVYDKISFLPKRFSYIMKSSKVPEKDKSDRDGVVITVLFRNYKKGQISDDFFSTGKYVQVVNGSAQLQPQYKQYHFLQTVPVISKHH